MYKEKLVSSIIHPYRADPPHPLEQILGMTLKQMVHGGDSLTKALLPL